MSVAGVWFDWDREKKTLLSKLEGGAVVRARFPSTDCLPLFAAALRRLLEESAKPNWKVIQFDADTTESRYFGEMIREVERNLSIAPRPSVPPSYGASTQIASHMNAGGAISIIDSFNANSGGYESAATRELLCQRILDHLASDHTNERFCFFFLHSERFLTADLRHFTQQLWQPLAHSPIGKRVALVDFWCGEPGFAVDWPPSPGAELIVSDRYDEVAERLVKEEVCQFILDRKLETSKEAAIGYAKALVDSSGGLPASLYSQLAVALSSRSRREI